ncbi:MAG: pyruvate kinase [Candidatus Omnitrophica bacterium]|nr:pyruvate kinase [Candidatus Omnitrophota bacterium]
MSRVKIVVTLGPRTDTNTTIRALAEAGADVARLNGSHGSLTWHAAAIAHIRAAAPQMPILFDLPGGKIRTGALEHEPTFCVGDQLVLTGDERHDGRVKVPVSHPQLHEALASGATILADDGQLRFTVQRIQGEDIICRAETAGTLRSHKGIHVSTLEPTAMPVTPRDRAMLQFAKEQAVDFVGVSFVERAEQIEAIRSLIGGASPRIIAKIETQRALEQLTSLLDFSDGLMIDRGDLSIDAGLHHVAILQKQMLKAARQAGRPAIVATEMLHSMISSPTPTKAEVSDISNAVLDGAAAVMLSGETAIGKFPVEAVATMRRIADTASSHLQSLLDDDAAQEPCSIPQAIEDAIALICRRLPVTKIVAVTAKGYAARVVAARSPRQPILAVSHDPATARSFQLLPGTEGIAVDIPFSRTSVDHIPKCLEALWRCGKLKDEDLVLVTAVGYPRSGNRMNLIQTHHIADLRDSLGWTR